MFIQQIFIELSPMCLGGALLNYFQSVGNTVVNKTEKIVPSQRLFL